MLHSANPLANRPGTTVTIRESPLSPFLLNEAYVAPTPPACIDQLSNILGKCQAPFRVTLRGVIADLSEMQVTVSEADKRSFNLVDDAGTWIKCCAIGMPARSLALVNGNEVVLYFCTGRHGIGTSPGMVYLMKDSLVVQLCTRAEMPLKRLQLEVTQG